MRSANSKTCDWSDKLKMAQTPEELVVSLEVSTLMERRIKGGGVFFFPL